MSSKERTLRDFGMIMIGILASIAFYTTLEQVRPDNASPRRHEFVVDIDATQILRATAEPGGPQLISLQPFEGQRSYWFKCEVVLADGTSWYQRDSDNTSYVRADFLSRPYDESAVTLPTCSGYR